MAGEVQLAPSLRSRFYGCPSTPSLLVKLQQPLLSLSFLLCVRGSGEAAMQLSLPRYQLERSWRTKPDLATWKVQGYFAHSLPLQAVRHGAGGRWFAGRTNQLQALSIS